MDIFSRKKNPNSKNKNYTNWYHSQPQETRDKILKNLQKGHYESKEETEFLDKLDERLKIQLVRHDKETIGMWLDAVIPEHKIAIEYHGPAHRDDYGRGKEYLEHIQEQDRKKKQLLQDKGWDLIIVSNLDSMEDMLDKAEKQVRNKLNSREVVSSFIIAVSDDELTSIKINVPGQGTESFSYSKEYESLDMLIEINENDNEGIFKVNGHPVAKISKKNIERLKWKDGRKKVRVFGGSPFQGIELDIKEHPVISLDTKAKFRFDTALRNKMSSSSELELISVYESKDRKIELLGADDHSEANKYGMKLHTQGYKQIKHSAFENGLKLITFDRQSLVWTTIHIVVGNYKENLVCNIHDKKEVGVLTGRTQERAKKKYLQVMYPVHANWKPEYVLEKC